MLDTLAEADSLMLNEMNSSLTDYGNHEQKKTKHELNQNAVKFHLKKLQSKTIRYEVIYKNLVRDIRKFFVADFNGTTCAEDKHPGRSEITKIFTLYGNITLKKFSDPLGLDLNELIFNFGSIVNPKIMLREHGQNPQAKLNIFKIFNYLYKFSLERLSQFVNNEYLFLLLCVYLKTVKYTRIHSSPNMNKHR